MGLFKAGKAKVKLIQWFFSIQSLKVVQINVERLRFSCFVVSYYKAIKSIKEFLYILYLCFCYSILHVWCVFIHFYLVKGDSRINYALEFDTRDCCLFPTDSRPPSFHYLNHVTTKIP